MIGSHPVMKTQPSSSSSSLQPLTDNSPPLLYTASGSGLAIVQIGFCGNGTEREQEDGGDGWSLLRVCMGNSGNLAACWTMTSNGGSSFTHCEIRFANGYVCSIHEYIRENVPGIVHCRPRELDRKPYSFIEFGVTYEQHDRMFKQAMSYADRRIPFNQAGMRLNFVAPFSWFPIERRETAFFCSELVVTLLQKIGKARDLQACVMSPNALYAYLITLPEMAISCNRNTMTESILASLRTPNPYDDEKKKKKNNKGGKLFIVK